ncbi:hypothetical protein CPB85DRAFT_1439206 [Mucidula mucida]|nr:hypothetical protein CPB85DRAFT_1439206 [Mucidula mucida]
MGGSFLLPEDASTKEIVGYAIVTGVLAIGVITGMTCLARMWCWKRHRESTLRRVNAAAGGWTSNPHIQLPSSS